MDDAPRLPRTLKTALHKPAGVAKSATESAEAVPLDHDMVRASLAALDEHLVKAAGGRSELTDADRHLADLGKAAAAKILTEGANAALSPPEQMALEAIAIADGSRPALLIHNGAIDPRDEKAGEWADKLKIYDTVIRAVSPRVGRINNGGRHVGTGWMIRPGYIVTNRHVAQVLSKDPIAAKLELSPLRTATVGFGHEADESDPGPQYAIKEIIFSGDQYIDPQNTNFALLDMAVLRMDSADKDKLPAALPSVFVAEREIVTGANLYVLGYPGPTAGSSLPQKTLLRLLGTQSSVKRFSPGEIVLPLGGVSGDAPKRTIAHDATTLGGSSGSAVLGFDETRQPRLVGLHFGGYEVLYGPSGEVEYRGRNFAHCFATMAEVLAKLDKAIVDDRNR
jgi:trypsin-like peptidase